MFVVFADQASTANIYTHEFNIACMHAAERLLFRETLSNGQSAKVYTLEIYPLYCIYIRIVSDNIIDCVLFLG